MFDGNEQLESTVDLPENPEPWSKYFTPTYNPQDESIPTPVIKLRKTMEAAEKAVSSKLRKLASRMRSYAPNQLSSGSVEWHKSYIDSVREFYLDLYDSIEDLCDDFSSELSPSRLQHWKDQLPKIDRDKTIWKVSNLSLIRSKKPSNLLNHQVKPWMDSKPSNLS